MLVFPDWAWGLVRQPHLREFCAAGEIKQAVQSSPKRSISSTVCTRNCGVLYEGNFRQQWVGGAPNRGKFMLSKSTSTSFTRALGKTRHYPYRRIRLQAWLKRMKGYGQQAQPRPKGALRASWFLWNQRWLQPVAQHCSWVPSLSSHCTLPRCSPLRHVPDQRILAPFP